MAQEETSAPSELILALQELAKVHGIDEFVILDRLEEALSETYTRALKLDWDARATIDRDTGRIYVYEMVGVGDEDPETGDYPDYEMQDVTPDDASRIAAQTAKRVINEIVRDAARMNIYKEFAGRKGELITGTVLQSTKDFTIVKIRDGVEAELPHYGSRRFADSDRPANEKPAGEYYQHNQRIKAVIIDVRDPSAARETPDGKRQSRNEASRPTIVVSRTHPDLIRRLLELEVPEIYDGVVEVKSIAREAGARSKIAVASRESNLDPVGACVGPKGSRIRMVVGELRGERIDVIQWSEDPSVFVANALSPAKVSDVLIDEDTQYATVVVPDDQLSLAIGKEGQNARLAAHLTGWHIDIKAASLVGSGGLSAGSLIDDEEDEAASEGADAQCAYVGESGVRCRNHARPGSRFCGVHQGAEEGEGADGAAAAGEAGAVDAADVADDEDSLI